MGELTSAEESLLERVTVEQLDKWIKVFEKWRFPCLYRDFARFEGSAKEFFKPKEYEPKPAETRPKRTVKLAAYRFSCVEGNAGLYNRHIRGFLRWNRGSAVWIKGSTVKREAYLVVKDFLKNQLAGMLSDELSRGGSLTSKIVNPLFVIRQAKELNRQTSGYLRYGRIELGDYDEIFCPLENLRRVSVRECCIGTEELQKPCPHWNRWRCIYPKKNAFAQAPKVETTWCPDRQEEVPTTYCLQCEKSDLAKWQACREFKEEEAAGVGL